MSQLFKIVIKPIKPKMKELHPTKIEALKEKRRLQREIRKNKPKEETEIKPKIIVDKTQIENINKTLKNLVGFNIDEINEKIKASRTTPVQVGVPKEEVVEIKKKGKKTKPI